MKFTKKKIGTYEIEVTTEVDSKEFLKAIKDAVKYFSNQINIPGFRKGKIPRNILEQYIGKEEILNKASDILIQQTTKQLFHQKLISPITIPVSKIIENKEGENFVFSLTYTEYPKVKVGQYKGIKVEKIVKPVTDEEVEAQLENFRNSKAKLIEADENETIALGDVITLDYVGTINGMELEGGTAKDEPLEIGSHKFIGTFEEQLIGAKVGEKRIVKAIFPDDYFKVDLRGQEATFECEINTLKHRELPELNNEFIKENSAFNTVEEFKADIRKKLEKNAEDRAIEEQQNKIIDKAIENMTVDVPPVMFENQIDNLVTSFENHLQVYGMTIEQYKKNMNMDDKAIRENYREQAKKEVFQSLLLDEVATIEKLEVSQQELSYELAALSQRYNIPAKQFVKYIDENNQITKILIRMRHNKALKFIFDSSNDSEEKESIESNESEN